VNAQPEDPAYTPGGLPGVHRPGFPFEAYEKLWKPGEQPVLTEEQRRHLLEAFQGWQHLGHSRLAPENEHGNPPPLDTTGWRGWSADLVIVDEVPPPGNTARDLEAMRDRLEENPGMFGPPLPQRPESPVCRCGHRKNGHREGSFDFRPGCWNCRDCPGFEALEG
jgi:hypothetical protein